MSLATSCPACGTVFRVIEDQLKVSEGWVRCGQCADVFNALESLFDLERAGPSPLTSPAAAPEISTSLPIDPRFDDTAVAAAAALPFPEVPEIPAPAWPVTEPIEPVWPDLPPPTVAAPPPPTATPASWELSTQFDLPSDTSFVSLADAPAADRVAGEVPTAWSDRIEPMADAGVETEAMSPLARAPTQPPSRTPADEPDDEAIESLPPLPGFVVRAQRQARWQRSSVRVMLSVAALLLLGGLAAQVAWHERNLVAARWPATAPALAALCEVSGCQLEPPRLLEALWVDNTVLTRPPGVDAYRLQVTLVNRMRFDVTAPHLELTMTDAVGALVARRVLGPADFRQPTVLPSGEQVWQLDFSSADRRFAGYTVTAFYP